MCSAAMPFTHGLELNLFSDHRLPRPGRADPTAMRSTRHRNALWKCHARPE